MMKKNGNRAGRLSVLIVTLVSFVFLWQGKLNVCAAKEGPPEQIERIFELTPEEILQVPKRIVEGMAVYELDEASIVVEETQNGSAEGANVIRFSKKVEDLQDNDLARIEKKSVIDGMGCELLNAVYKVEEKDKNGVPVRYSAVCEYGGLKKYSTSYPTAWRMTACYHLSGMLSEEEIVEMQEEAAAKKSARYEETRTRRIFSGREHKRREKEIEERELFPKPEIKRIRIKPTTQEEGKDIADVLLPLAAGAAATGLAVPFIIWFYILRAPLFGMKEGGKYRYIGRIRLKKEEKGYAAYLTKRLKRRAQLPVFQIKLQKRVWKSARAGGFFVYCPGGQKIAPTVGRVIHFTVEGE